jgi:preprotein translocase subunit SecG
MFYGFVIFIHVAACAILIAVILLQAGRGGGLSETFGGEAPQTIFGTKVSVVLTRATVVAAAMFLFTSLALGIMTSRRGRSLVEMEAQEAPPVGMPEPQPGEIPGLPGGMPELPATEAPAAAEEAPLAESEAPAQ